MSEHISANQLSTWIRCPKQYEFRYLLGYKLPPTGALTRGRACHRAWEADHRNKIETKKNLPLQNILDIYSGEFDASAPETEWNPDEDKGKVKDTGTKMVEVYHCKISKQVQPIACEEPFEIEIQDHVVQGVIDLETDQHEIRDAKTTSKRRPYIPMDHQLQMTIYSRAKPKAASFILDNAIVTQKETDLETLTLTRSELPQKKLDLFLESFGQSLTKGYFPPTNPDNWWCSQKWCGFYRICKFGAGDK